MSKIKCFDVVESVVDEATERFAPTFVENSKNKSILKSYCEALDSIIEEISGTSIEVEVDEIKMTITVSIGCDEVVVYPESELFYKITERATAVGFHISEDPDSIVIDFVFPSIWELAI